MLGCTPRSPAPTLPLRCTGAPAACDCSPLLLPPLLLAGEERGLREEKEGRGEAKVGEEGEEAEGEELAWVGVEEGGVAQPKRELKRPPGVALPLLLDLGEPPSVCTPTLH